MKKKSNFLGKKVGEAVAEKGRQKDGKSEDEVQFPAKIVFCRYNHQSPFFLEKLESNLSSSSHNKKNCFFFLFIFFVSFVSSAQREKLVVEL